MRQLSMKFSTALMLLPHQNRDLIVSPIHDGVEAIRTLDGVATAYEANEFVFEPLQFLFSPFTCGPGVQEVAPLMVMADPETDPHRRPPVYSSDSPMGRMMVLTAWSVIGTTVAWKMPLPDGTAVVDWVDLLVPAAIVVVCFALLWWVLGLVATLLAGRFNLVPVMNNRTYGIWAICAALGGFIGGVSSQLSP